MKYLPYVVETAVGVDRMILVVLCDSYHEEEVDGTERVVMRLHPRLAPIKVAIFPLVKKNGIPEIAQGLHEACKKAAIPNFYDVSGAIGRRYRRQDEVGTPWCVTVDGQTVEDGTVTIRDRDTLEQVRVGTDHVVGILQERLTSGA